MNIPSYPGFKIAVLGLGYVGFPLYKLLSNHYSVLGFDIDRMRIKELNASFDRTGEVGRSDFCDGQLNLSYDLESLNDIDVYIITVPTPIDNQNLPDFSLVEKACNYVGCRLVKDNIVIFESTVFPGATEEICVPILENRSGLELNKDFGVGYSPERVSPGVGLKKISDIVKVTSGSSDLVASFVDDLYSRVIPAGTFKASSIKVAEAAKVIENTQRDLNIALVNELSIIFDKLNIDTQEVLDAADTKWNFVKYSPGLVGGHCIGVDPYYLTYKAKQIGYTPNIILSGRELNNKMAELVGVRLAKDIYAKQSEPSLRRVLILGLAFKENCPDIRNSKVFDLIDTLVSFNISVTVYDPLVLKTDSLLQSNFKLVDAVQEKSFDGIIVAVGHDRFKEMGIETIKSYGRSGAVLYDLKSIFDKNDSNFRL